MYVHTDIDGCTYTQTLHTHNSVIQCCDAKWGTGALIHSRKQQGGGCSGVRSHGQGVGRQTQQQLRYMLAVFFLDSRERRKHLSKHGKCMDVFIFISHGGAEILPIFQQQHKQSAEPQGCLFL